MHASTARLTALTRAGRYSPSPLQGVVLGLEENGTIRVAVGAGPSVVLVCDLLRTAEAPTLQLVPGCTVLVLPPLAEKERGLVLGTIATDERVVELPSEAPPDELVLQAGKSLTLRVGEGSITIREDGRILIKGRDLVSHAKRMNRIRGGSVEIN